VSYIIAGIIGSWVLSLLYGSAVSGYTNVFQLIIIVSTLSSINMCLIVVFTAIRKLIPQSIILLLGCLICYLITPSIVTTYAMEGVTYSLIIAQLFQITIALIFAVFYIQKIKQTSKTIESE
jgi:hypothetical protein